MTPEQIFTIGQHALMVLLMVCAPMLLAILAVGVFISIVQAATQIHEATLTFVPKLVIAVVVLLITGPWMTQTLVDYLRQMLLSLPTAVG